MIRLFLLALLLPSLAFAAGQAKTELDPDSELWEVLPEVAVHPSGKMLLTWSFVSPFDPSGEWSAVAAHFDANSGHLDPWSRVGSGQLTQAVPLREGFLALRRHVTPNVDWSACVLDVYGNLLREHSLGVLRVARVTATPDGGAVIVATGPQEVQAWRVLPDGFLQGPGTILDGLGFGIQVDVASVPDGSLVVVWTDTRTRLWARRFSPDLRPVGGGTPVFLGVASKARLAVAPDGRSLVAYVQGSWLWLRAFNAHGDVVRKRLRLSPRRDYVDKDNFDIALDGDEALVVWKAYRDASPPKLFGQYVTTSGRPAGAKFRVTPAARQGVDILQPRVEYTTNADYVVVWTRLAAHGGTTLGVVTRSSGAPH